DRATYHLDWPLVLGNHDLEHPEAGSITQGLSHIHPLPRERSHPVDEGSTGHPCSELERCIERPHLHPRLWVLASGSGALPSSTPPSQQDHMGFTYGIALH